MSTTMLLLIGATLAAAQAAAQEYVGYVVRVTGSWTLEMPRDPAHPVKVAQWQEVPVGSRLTPGGGTGEVGVWLVDGRVQAFDAVKPDTWKQPITLHATPESAGDKWIALAMRWLSAKPQVVVPAMARTPNAVTPIPDQVVPWSSGGVDPATVLGAAVQQPLILRFEPVSSEGKAMVEEAVMLDWDPAAGRKPSLAIRPALYRMVALDADGLRPGQEAWVLAVQPGDYPSLSAAFQNLERIAALWAKDDPRSARGFLRGALLSLANEPPAK
jgi:hypothetical protein